MIKQSALFLAFFVASSSAIELTPDNFFSETGGKTVFLKFFAPWCGHCKELKPTWDKLIADFADSSTQLIADVDCTTEGQKLCDQFGIEGFPTLKWGDPSDLQDYNGGRSYEDLKKFADESLKPLCSVKNIDLCDDDKKAQIKTYQEMTMDALETEVAKEEDKIMTAEQKFEEEVQKLQEKFEELSKEKDEAVAAVKASGLGLMKSVMMSKVPGQEGKDEL